MHTHTGLAGTTHTVLRVGAGLLFMAHGAQKLLGWFGGFGGQPGATASLMSQMGLAGILELVGGGLLVLGVLTRPVAFVLAAEMVVAYVMAHLPKGLLPIENQGEPAALYFLIFVFLFGNGAGRFSVDHWMSGRRRGIAGEKREGDVDVLREYRVPGMQKAPKRAHTRDRKTEQEQGD